MEQSRKAHHDKDPRPDMTFSLQHHDNQHHFSAATMKESQRIFLIV
jgi:hypothetical protein